MNKLYEETAEMLMHWREARQKMSKEEQAENLRCVVDVVKLIKEITGMEIPKKFYL